VEGYVLVKLGNMLVQQCERPMSGLSVLQQKCGASYSVDKPSVLARGRAVCTMQSDRMQLSLTLTEQLDELFCLASGCEFHL